MTDPIITYGIALMTPVIKESVSWLWSAFGDALVKRGIDEAKWRWGVENYYTSLYERVGFVRVLGKLDSEPIEAIFTQINVLDKPTAELRYRLDEAQAMWRERRMQYDWRVERMDALAALREYPKLFILGKPGAGKTTFLKYAAVQAIQREIALFPIFVTLKEMSDDNPALRSGDDILDFIVKRAVFRIPEPRDFVVRLLTQGRALVLFDGLDEVNLAGDRRSNMINALNQFVQQFNASQYALTCRVAATDYSFTQFAYVEMADFDDEQIGAFVDKWFAGDETKLKACKQELTGDNANKMLRELAQVPLLLTLLCLVYEERNEFPPNRAEIYEEATRALLSKWDASRNIRRDTDNSVYEKLTLKGKQDLLAYLAAQTFEDGAYLVERRRLAQLIEDYLDGAPGIDDADGELIVREIAAQHGLLVERTRDIWSFSHLTLQEYFAATYIVKHEAGGTLQGLCNHVGDDRWREVFLLTAGMVGDATALADLYVKRLQRMIAGDDKLVRLLDWVTNKSACVQTSFRAISTRAIYLRLVLIEVRVIAHDLTLDCDLSLDQALVVSLSCAEIIIRDYDDKSAIASYYDQDHTQVNVPVTFPMFLVAFRADAYTSDLVSTLLNDRGRIVTRFVYNDPVNAYKDILLQDLACAIECTAKLGLDSLHDELNHLQRNLPAENADQGVWQAWSEQLRQVMIAERNIGHEWGWTKEQEALLNQCLGANLLLIQCLDVAYMPSEKREAIKDSLLLPPSK